MKFVLTLFGLLLQLVGCAAPFSDFQSARLAGKGQVEVTPSYSTVGISGEQFQDQLGGQFAVGVSDDLDFRARYERVWIDGSDVDHVNVIGFGPKIPLHRDRAAFYLPVGCAFGENIETPRTWEAHPTLITTQVVNGRFEVNVSAKALLSLNDDTFNTRFALNLGFGFGPDIMTYIFRPEAGILFHVSGGDPFYHFGVGVSMATTKRKRSETAGKSGKN
jgi:hypothetical protein